MGYTPSSDPGLLSRIFAPPFAMAAGQVKGCWRSGSSLSPWSRVILNGKKGGLELRCGDFLPTGSGERRPQDAVLCYKVVGA